MKNPYYTLIGYYPEDKRFEIIFGDYDLETVKDELNSSGDMHEDYSKFHIMRTEDLQKDIDLGMKLYQIGFHAGIMYAALLKKYGKEDVKYMILETHEGREYVASFYPDEYEEIIEVVNAKVKTDFPI